jgi:hypothetical protein
MPLINALTRTNWMTNYEGKPRCRASVLSLFCDCVVKEIQPSSEGPSSGSEWPTITINYTTTFPLSLKSLRC